MGRPANKRRKTIQKKRRQLQTVREDLQLLGAEPTVPEGAIRQERVDPASQDEQRFPGLDVAAIRADGDTWAVPAAVKRKVIEVNAKELFREPERIKLQDGREVEVIDKKAQQQASRVLMEADARQWERDHPEAKAGTQVNVGVQVNTGAEIAELMRRVEAQKQVGQELQAEAVEGQQ